jgi:hypothetical protein
MTILVLLGDEAVMLDYLKDNFAAIVSAWERFWHPADHLIMAQYPSGNSLHRT